MPARSRPAGATFASSARRRRGARASSVAAALVVVVLAGCSSAQTVVAKHAVPAAQAGTTTYTVVTRPGPIGTQGTLRYTRTAGAADAWVRECFNHASAGDPLPYFCLSGRTALEAWLIALTFVLAIAGTWLAARRFVARLPRPAAPAPTGAPAGTVDGDWLLARQARERTAFDAAGGHIAQDRYAATRYALRATGGGALYGLAVTAILAAVIGSHPAGNWVVIAAAAHIPVIGFAYIAWAMRGAVGNARHLRALFVVGAMGGLAACGVILMTLHGVPGLF